MPDDDLRKGRNMWHTCKVTSLIKLKLVMFDVLSAIMY